MYGNGGQWLVMLGSLLLCFCSIWWLRGLPSLVLEWSLTCNVLILTVMHNYTSLDNPPHKCQTPRNLILTNSRLDPVWPNLGHSFFSMIFSWFLFKRLTPFRRTLETSEKRFTLAKCVHLLNAMHELFLLDSRIAIMMVLKRVLTFTPFKDPDGVSIRVLVGRPVCGLRRHLLWNVLDRSWGAFCRWSRIFNRH